MLQKFRPCTVLSVWHIVSRIALDAICIIIADVLLKVLIIDQQIMCVISLW